MTRLSIVAGILAALAACVGGSEPFDGGFDDLEAVGVFGSPEPVSLAVSADGRVAFGGGYNQLWVQDALGTGGRYEPIPGPYVATVGEHLVVAGGTNAGPGAGIYTTGDGWASLGLSAESPLTIRHLAVDAARVAVTGGSEVLVLDRDRFLAGAGEDEAEVVLRWQPDAPAWWQGTVVASALRGDVLWIAAGDGVRGYDIGVDPPVLLHVLGDNDTYGLHLEGDVLIVSQNESAAKFDVTDPRAPRVSGRILGGDALDVGGDYVFGASSTDFTVSRLGAPGERPEPLRQLPLQACLAVAALNDRVLASCDDQGTYELAPLDP